MAPEETRRRSRWIIRILEWDDPRARYPNIWHEGMPCQILAFDSVASRLRLGDLVAVYHPASRRHPERAERFLGLSRVVGLRRAHDPAFAWVDLQTAHRFGPPLELGRSPRRVFLCCDPGWPAQDVGLFREAFMAAVDAGWVPAPEEMEEGAPAGAPEPVARPAPHEAEGTEEEGGEEEEGKAPASPAAGEPPPASATRPAMPAIGPLPTGRVFGGVDYSGDMRDPREATWMALLRLSGDRLQVVHLEPTGRGGLQAHLRDADTALIHVEAVGLDFPFGLPLPFGETLLGGAFPQEGWWALAKRLERMSRPQYLVSLQEFRDHHGELKRYTDEVARAFSPLHRINPDLGPMTYHGIRMIAADRSRYAVRPFERARGRLLLEVYPGGALERLGLDRGRAKREARRAIVSSLGRLERLPVDVGEPFLGRCLARADALDAIVAARCAAVAVLSGETEKGPEGLAPEAAGRVRLEGWIYGIEAPASDRPSA